MQNPELLNIVEGLTKTGTKAIEAEDFASGILAGSFAGLISVVATLNSTLEEIRDAIKETSDDARRVR